MIPGSYKVALIILGSLAAVLIVTQLVLGQLIVWGRSGLVTAHQHSGYTTVAVVLVYLILSLITIASTPSRPKT